MALVSWVNLGLRRPIADVGLVSWVNLDLKTPVTDVGNG